MAKGTRVGLSNIHFAKILEETETTVTYDTPVKIGAAIEATITPGVNSETLYGDDGVVDVATAQGATEISIGVDELDHDSQALLLGHFINEDGVIEKKETDDAPYGALLFESATLAKEKKLYVLYKGKFQLQEESFATKTDSPEFQTDSLSGTFFGRKHDKVWQRSIFTGRKGVNPEVVANWFKKVYEPSQSQTITGTALDLGGVSAESTIPEV
ncbi:major tail protein [Priestia aryabhattai]|uniref:major tail protein n=1 Tax=Priestia aryabhattai TaxID=412384 RepID=UPI003CBBEE9F